MSEQPQEVASDADGDHAQELKTCGIVRPIAAMGDYPAAHWEDVHAIVAEAAADAGYKLKIVSESDAGGVILSDIVTNLYNNEIVVADVSGRNPNVMFELGMRMAFEKPVIIVTDNQTPFSFDISPVKHLQYPRSLRFGSIIKFKSDLSLALKASVQATKQKGYKGYLQQFGRIEVTKVADQEIDLSELAEGIVDLRRMVQGLSARVPEQVQNAPGYDHLLELGFAATQKEALRSGSDFLGGFGSHLQVAQDKVENVVTAVRRVAGVKPNTVKVVPGTRRIIRIEYVGDFPAFGVMMDVLAAAKKIDSSALFIKG